MTLRNIAVLGLILALPAAAYAQPAEKRIIFNVGAGPAITLSDTRDRFGNGVEVLGGVAVSATERLDLGFEYGISWHNVKGLFFELPSLQGNMRMQELGLKAKYWLNDRRQTFAFYLIGAPALYRRDVSVTYFSNVTDPVCDPYLLICEQNPEANLLGSRGSWDFGFSFGGGFTFPLTDYLRMSVDTRYAYIWGPELGAIATPLASGTPTKANGQFLPLRIGFLF